MLAQKDVHVDDGDYDKRTGLHIATAEGFYEMVKYLVENGANVNVTDRWGRTPLDGKIR